MCVHGANSYGRRGMIFSGGFPAPPHDAATPSLGGESFTGKGEGCHSILCVPNGDSTRKLAVNKRSTKLGACWGDAESEEGGGKISLLPTQYGIEKLEKQGRGCDTSLDDRR